jgi:hypothetical protein
MRNSRNDVMEKRLPQHQIERNMLKYPLAQMLENRDKEVKDLETRSKLQKTRPHLVK